MEARHRGEGSRAAANCRLGDLAADVHRAARDEDDPRVIAVAICSARVLGVEIEGLELAAAPLDPATLFEADDDGVTADGAASFKEESQRLAERREQIRNELRREALARGARGGGGGGGGGGLSDAPAGSDSNGR